MATKLTKTVMREVETKAGTVALVALREDGLWIGERVPGRRTCYYGPIPYGRLLVLGAQILADERQGVERVLRRARGGKR